MPKPAMTAQLRDIALTLMEGLNCPRSLSVAIMLRHEEWSQLAHLEVDPKLYIDAESYFGAAAATDFFRKYDSFPLGLDLETQAVEKWYECERQCFLTNRRLNEIMDFGTLRGTPVHDGILHFVETFRKNLLWLVGDRPEALFQGAFGPGATVSDDSARTSVPHKMSSRPTLTTSALFYLFPWMGTKWAAACAARGEEVQIVKGNSFFTVSKHSRARRSCAKEPAINGFYQLGLGRCMRKRLKARGIDLRHGQNIHRQVACAGSETGEFCTIDLSSASDLICSALVKLCMPHGWHECLADLRSPYTKVKGKQVRLEKFSSMGNGFTFELETAIFCGICMTVMGQEGIPGHNIFVYGDDIIVPRKFYDEVISALKFFGLVPNPSKCFKDGNFRESCGGDFFNGVAVRPLYLENEPNEPQQLIALANGIRRLAKQGTDSSYRWHSLRRAWFRCLDNLPAAIRACRGPEGLGDLVIHDDEANWNARWRANCIRYIRVYRPARFLGTRWDRFDPDVQFAAALYGVSLRQIARAHKVIDNRSVLTRDCVAGYKVGWVPYS